MVISTHLHVPGPVLTQNLFFGHRLAMQQRDGPDCGVLMLQMVETLRISRKVRSAAFIFAYLGTKIEHDMIKNNVKNVIM